MINLKELRNKLKTCGYEVAYDHFEERDVPSIPIIIIKEIGSSNYAVDGIVYDRKNRYQVKLITAKKDPVVEGEVEQALSNYFWEKEMEYDSNEHTYEVNYTIEY